jgi:ubiquitin C-terminal hydrolase
MKKANMSAESVQDKGVVGIANVGNTCYANAAMQLFRHCPEWSSFCLQGLAQKEIQDLSGNPAKVLNGYLDILKPLWSGGKPSYIQPAGFWQMMSEVVRGTIYEDFLIRIPHDAHEFLVWLLDQQYIATQKERTFKITDVINKDDQAEMMAREAVKAWIDAFKKTYSPLTDLCFGLIRTTSTCQGCGAETRSWDTFNMLKIQPGNGGEDNSLAGMLARELATERIEDFACDKCKERCTVERSHRIWRLPRNLFVVVRRFNPNGTKNQMPLQYDGSTLSFESSFAEESPEISKGYKFDFYGAVDHHGHHMGGHYTCQALSPLSGKWWLYDDETAHPLDGPKFGSSTYILGFKMSS